jgi:hypothetical protein
MARTGLFVDGPARPMVVGIAVCALAVLTRNTLAGAGRRAATS